MHYPTPTSSTFFYFILLLFLVSQQILWVTEQNNAANNTRSKKLIEKVMHYILKQATLSMCKYSAPPLCFEMV